MPEYAFANVVSSMFSLVVGPINGETSIVDGFIPWFFFIVAPLSLLLSLGWKNGVWKRQLAFAVPVVAILTLIIIVVNEHFKVVPYAFPFFFYLAFGLVLFAVGIAIIGWRNDGNWQRLASVVATLTTMCMLGILINDHYRYRPTIDALLGQVVQNELSTSDLGVISNQVKTTGTLPASGYTLHTPIPGPTSDFKARDGYIYLPPAFFADPSPDLPVILMLHGVPGGPEDWPQAGNVDRVANAFAATNGSKTPILVMADLSAETNNDTQCTDTAAHGKSESYLSIDVPDYMHNTFHTATGPNSLGVAGFSVGGFCALMLPVRHPDVFSVFGDYSGFSEPTLDPPGDALTDLFSGDQQQFDDYDPTKLIPKQTFPGVSGWFETGSEDPDPLDPTKLVAAQATKAGMTTCLVIRPGGHDFFFWEQAFRNSLPWMSWRLGIAPKPVELPGAQCTYPPDH